MTTNCCLTLLIEAHLLVTLIKNTNTKKEKKHKKSIAGIKKEQTKKNKQQPPSSHMSLSSDISINAFIGCCPGRNYDK